MRAQISRYFNADLPWVEQKLGFLCVSWAVDVVWWRLLREMRGDADFCKRCFYMYLSLLSTKLAGKKNRYFWWPCACQACVYKGSKISRNHRGGFKFGFASKHNVAVVVWV